MERQRTRPWLRRVIWLALLVAAAFAAYPYVRIWRLNWIAHCSGNGSMGCGIGFVTLHTSNGVIKVQTGLDPIHVFGPEIYVSTLLDLVEQRSRCQGEGIAPAVGNVGALYYVVLSTLAKSKDETVIRPVSGLLNDPNEVISAWAAIALIRLGEQNEAMRERVASMRFPAKAMWGARNRGVESPSWLVRNVDGRNGAPTTPPIVQ